MITFGGTTVRDLAFDTTGLNGGLNLVDAAIGERLRVAHDEATNPAVFVQNTVTLRDSVVIERAPGGVAVDAGGAGNAVVLLDNVTAMATGAGGTGVDVTTVGDYLSACHGPGPTHATVRNTIARGPGTDLRVRMYHPMAGCRSLPPTSTTPTSARARSPTRVS